MIERGEVARTTNRRDCVLAVRRGLRVVARGNLEHRQRALKLRWACDEWHRKASHGLNCNPVR